MIAAVDVVLATVEPRGSEGRRRPRVAWLSTRPRPGVVSIGRYLGLDVDVLPVDEIEGVRDGSGPVRAPHPSGPGDLRRASTRARSGAEYDLVTADVRATARLDRERAGVVRLEHLARRTGAQCPNAVALGLAADPSTARSALAAAGFSVTDGSAPGARVCVARRPSGWWGPVVPVPSTESQPGSLELAASIAAGLDVAGVVEVEVVGSDAGDLRVNRLRIGPDPDDGEAVEAHLRGLCDLPLTAHPAGLAG